MNSLYKVIGISKQAVHQYALREALFEEKLRVLLREAEELRAEHPGCGVEKMYYTLSPDFIGRDRFIELFMQLGFRLKKAKNYRRTTIASKLYYPNLIKGMQINGPNVIWQSDITYIEVVNRFYYAVFITDVYTKEIVGYSVSDHMRATANLQALKMAIKKYGVPKIHHSDRGSQYVYKAYINLLKSHHTMISMGLTAQDNAYAERINRTIKEEYLSKWNIHSFKELKRATNKAVKHYNTKRLHNHLNRMVPGEFRKYVLSLDEQERPVITIYPEVKNDEK
jgi:transposase InsO family protein